jgi:hypothetical protein
VVVVVEPLDELEHAGSAAKRKPTPSSARRSWTVVNEVAWFMFTARYQALGGRVNARV